MTKPSIDWDQIPNQFKYLVNLPRPREGFVAMVFTEHPFVQSGSHSRWIWAGQYKPIHTEEYPSYKPGDCDWRDSLIERPIATYKAADTLKTQPMEPQLQLLKDIKDFSNVNEFKDSEWEHADTYP